MRRNWKTSLLFALTLTLPAIHAAAGSRCIDLRAERLLDVRTGIYQSPARLLIRDGQIVPLEEKPRQCTIVQLNKATLLPGLIDAHTHLLLRDRTSFANFQGELIKAIETKKNERLSWGKRNAREFLHAGFTTVRDLGNSGIFLDVELRSMIASGKTPGPRILCSGPGISGPGGQFAPGTPRSVVSKEYLTANTPQSAKAAVQIVKQRQVDWVKIFADGDPHPAHMPRDVFSGAVNEAHALGLKVAAHATNDASARLAVTSGADSLEHGYDISAATLKEMAARHTILVPTDFSRKLIEIIARKNPDQQFLDADEFQKRRAVRLKAAAELNVPIAFGSDVYADFSAAGLDAGKAALQALYAYTEEGLTAQQALRAATLGAAELLGLSGRLGALEPGFTADIIALKGDPLANISDLDRVAFVMKEGKIQKRIGL